MEPVLLIRRFKFSIPSPLDLWGINQLAIANDLINPVYIMNPPEKSRKAGLRELPSR